LRGNNYFCFKENSKPFFTFAASGNNKNYTSIMSPNNSGRSAFLPFFYAAALLVGVFIGTRLNISDRRFSFSTSSKGDKISRIIQIIDREYVDEINVDSLSEVAIATLLSELDPHSSYIPAADLSSINEDMEGNFEGVGIEFGILSDTIHVLAIISGGPAEKAGVRPGDRIVRIEEEVVAGKKIKNEEVIKKLRGPKGSEVQIYISRKGQKDLLPIKIKRDKIPLYSVDAFFMLDATTGYIKISRFSATTFEEYEKALNTLKESGAQKLILDLRGNPGGYLEQAVKICDDFLPKGEVIVYTEGKNRKKESRYATARGNWEKQPLVVLIDETSASASEIVAGALQDQDRATIVGRRSFGKGLVQEQMEFNDGSAMRLTVARYYMPSGRSIQRPYKNGNKEYYMEIYHRDETSETDTSQTAYDTLKYYTKNKRVIYGGGGVRPDVEVKRDTGSFSMAFIKLNNDGTLGNFAFDFADKNRNRLKNLPGGFRQFAQTPDNEILKAFFDYLKISGTAYPGSISPAEKTHIKAAIARNIWGNEGYYYIDVQDDKDVKTAKEILGQ
jgi:carboxyl-terminal processing protease